MTIFNALICGKFWSTAVYFKYLIVNHKHFCFFQYKLNSRQKKRISLIKLKYKEKELMDFVKSTCYRTFLSILHFHFNGLNHYFLKKINHLVRKKKPSNSFIQMKLSKAQMILQICSLKKAIMTPMNAR